MRFIKAYGQGILFSMPTAAQIFAMILFGYSLWAWVDFIPWEATAIGLGTVASFVVTGGFAQAVARRSLFYIHQNEYILTKRVCYRFFFFGLAAVAAVGLLLFLINLLFDFVSPGIAFYSQLYYLLLSTLWLSLSILYMLRQQLLFSVITVVGIIVVHLVVLFTRWQMIAAHSLGLATSILLSFIAGWAILYRKAKQAKGEQTVSELPRASMLVYAVAPYFWYGTLYFAFLFADRIMAWSGGKGRGLLPYFIWFDTPYELGMDWALLCFVLTVGVLEFTIQEFSERIIPKVFFNPLTKFVSWWAAIGYVFLVWSLFNSVFLFALSRPTLVLRSLGIAFLVNLVVGFILSRGFRYELAAVGLTIGSLAFMLISGYYARRAFAHLDYYYYSAY